MKLILVDPNDLLCEKLRIHFDGLPDVEVVEGYFEELPEFDCMVSAANSFGLMDGGVDAAIIRFFGSNLMQRVQQRILDDYLGEQPIGTSFIIETKNVKHPYIAHTPTMRIPMSIANTDHVYVAMWAMLLAVRHHNDASKQKINIVACPGLGTYSGKVPFAEGARQMALAYKNFLNPPQHMDWRYAQSRQSSIRYGGG